MCVLFSYNTSLMILSKRVNAVIRRIRYPLFLRESERLFVIIRDACKGLMFLRE